MIERLNEKLNITEEQKIELVGLLFSYIKTIRREERFRKLTSEELTSYWIKYVKKPDWIEKRIANEIEFVARIHDFIDMYIDGLMGKNINEVGVDLKETLNVDFVEFLKGIRGTKCKEIDTRNVRWFDKEKLLEEIDREFYVDYPPNDESEMISKLMDYTI